jgi:hypothetical protein
MNTASIDLWPTIAEDSAIRPPFVVLKEQAALLGTKTKNIVEGRIRKIDPMELPDDDQFGFEFYIYAPAMEYRFDLFRVTYGISMYPVRVWYAWSDKKASQACPDESSYIEMLRLIFTAPSTLKIVQALLAQSRAYA